MKIKKIAAAVALVGLGVTNAFAVDGSLGTLIPSASFSRTVSGAFSDNWTFDIGASSIVGASLTNVQISFGGDVGGIDGFKAKLNETFLILTESPPPVTVKLLAGAVTLGAGTYHLVVTGTGITGASASYGGNIVATPVPEPEPYVMLLAGLGVVGFVAARRRPRR